MRLFNTIGPRQTGQYGMVVPRFVRQAMRGEPLTVFGNGMQKRCFAYIDDVIGAIVGLEKHPDAVGQIFNIGTTQEVTIKELAERVIQIVGSESEINFIPYHEAYEEGFEDMERRVPDLRKIRNLIGYEPKTGLNESIEKIFRYYDDKDKAEAPKENLNLFSYDSQDG